MLDRIVAPELSHHLYGLGSLIMNYIVVICPYFCPVSRQGLNRTAQSAPPIPQHPVTSLRLRVTSRPAGHDERHRAGSD